MALDYVKFNDNDAHTRENECPFWVMINSEGGFDDGYDSNHIERVLKCVVV